jgi:hypothetical protein
MKAENSGLTNLKTVSLAPFYLLGTKGRSPEPVNTVPERRIYRSRGGVVGC